MTQHSSHGLLKMLHVQLEEEAAQRVRSRIDAVFGPGSSKPTNGHAVFVRRGRRSPGRMRQIAALKAYWAAKRKKKSDGNP